MNSNTAARTASHHHPPTMSYYPSYQEPGSHHLPHLVTPNRGAVVYQQQQSQQQPSSHPHCPKSAFPCFPTFAYNNNNNTPDRKCQPGSLEHHWLSNCQNNKKTLLKMKTLEKCSETTMKSGIDHLEGLPELEDPWEDTENLSSFVEPKKTTFMEMDDDDDDDEIEVVRVVSPHVSERMVVIPSPTPLLSLPLLNDNDDDDNLPSAADDLFLIDAILVEDDAYCSSSNRDGGQGANNTHSNIPKATANPNHQQYQWHHPYKTEALFGDTDYFEQVCRNMVHDTYASSSSSSAAASTPTIGTTTTMPSNPSTRPVVSPDMWGQRIPCRRVRELQA